MAGGYQQWRWRDNQHNWGRQAQTRKRVHLGIRLGAASIAAPFDPITKRFLGAAGSLLEECFAAMALIRFGNRLQD